MLCPLLMSSSWPTAAQKKSHASTGIGPFHALSYTDKQLALAHQIHNRLPHETAAWANMILISGMAAKRNARTGPCTTGRRMGLPRGPTWLSLAGWLQREMLALACDMTALAMPMSLQT